MLVKNMAQVAQGVKKVKIFSALTEYWYTSPVA